jgi:serine/threonine-protein kinase RsbW
MRRELKLESNTNSLHEVEKFVEEISDEFFLNDNYFGNILISLTEAVKNAIIHGNKLDPNKKVYLLFESRQEGLVFTVFDQGAGFNYKSYSDPSKLFEDPSLPGSGLMLIHSLADEVKFQNKGRTLEMLFRVTGIGDKIMNQRYELMNQFFKVTAKSKSR